VPRPRARFSRRLARAHAPGFVTSRDSSAARRSAVARRHAVEAAHPALQPAVVGVDILDVERTVAHPQAAGDVDRLVVQPLLGGKAGVSLGAVGAEHGIWRHRRAQRRRDRLRARVGPHGINGVTRAVAGDQGRDLLRRETPLAGWLATAAWLPLEVHLGVAPSTRAFVRAAKKRLVGLDHPGERLLGRRRRSQEAVPPAEAGRQSGARRYAPPPAPGSCPGRGLGRKPASMPSCAALPGSCRSRR
jgi:hypothetical protein